MKRFYKNAQYNENDGIYHITLDDKAVKTPAKNALTCQRETLAKAVCAEWNAQQDKILPDTMPITQYCYTALDYIPQNRDEIIKTILNFLNTDLICYRTEAPQDLAKKQAGAWDPFLLWFEKQFAAKLTTTTGLSALKQSESAHEATSKHVHAMCDEELTIAQALTAACGSLVMALCFVKGDVSLDDIFNATFVEELHQGAIYDEERYGIDPIQEKQRARLRSDLKAAEIYLSALR